jgi:ABC-type sugar transport system ATPase subunit
MNVMASAAAPDAPRLEVHNVSKAYRNKPALDGVSFLVPEGALTVILGAAGAGKTTTLRIIAGLEQPDDGRIMLGGQDSAGVEPKHRNVAMIFDNLALYPNKTGFQNIANPLRIAGMRQKQIETKVREVAASLKIAHILGRLPKTMSGGERQRVALGRALVREPSLFLLDEPLSSLDAMLRIELRAELRRLQKELGYTFLLATPDFAEAIAIADTIVLLREGRVVQIADPQTLYEQPADREVAKFVGTPEINLVRAHYTPGDGGCVHLEGARYRAPAALSRRLPRSDLDFEAGLRPEHIRLSSPVDGDLQGRVADIEPLGVDAVVMVTTTGAELRLVLPVRSIPNLAAGDVVGLSIAAEHMLAFDLITKARLA